MEGAPSISGVVRWVWWRGGISAGCFLTKTNASNGIYIDGLGICSALLCYGRVGLAALRLVPRNSSYFSRPRVGSASERVLRRPTPPRYPHPKVTLLSCPPLALAGIQTSVSGSGV